MRESDAVVGMASDVGLAGGNGDRHEGDPIDIRVGSGCMYLRFECDYQLPAASRYVCGCYFGCDDFDTASHDDGGWGCGPPVVAVRPAEASSVRLTFPSWNRGRGRRGVSCSR